jgi:hypothetical protein
MKYTVLRLLTLPADILGWLIIVFIRLCWGTKLQSKEGILTTTLRKDSWPIRSWYKNWGGTTFGHAMMFNPYTENVNRLFSHEKVHVEQFEVVAILSLPLAIWLVVQTNYVFAAAVILFSGFINVLTALFVAWLRGENPYRGSVLEEAAYDSTDLHDPEAR